MKKIIVNIGEVKYSNEPVTFKCSGIGSCIILFIYDLRKKIGGIAHIMLPEAPVTFGFNEGLYARTSPVMLIDGLLKMGANITTLRAKIIGGANLFQWSESLQLTDLGRKNFEVVKHELIKNKIYIAAEEVGGFLSKNVACCLKTGSVTIQYKKEFEKVI